MIEAFIRDHLADNLNFIEAGLTLIKKEYSLPNVHGSKGYIDILCKDQYENFVIIEIKRSKNSSRETVQELLKYVGLLKQNFHARDSEIRAILISTDWTELLVPFSELRSQTSLTVKGLKIALDEANVPKDIEVIEPITLSARRSIARSSYLLGFFAEEKRADCIETISARCNEIGVNDFVMLSLTYHDRGETSGYIYQLFFAMRSLSVNESLHILTNAGESMDMEPDELETPEEYRQYAEETVLTCLQTHRHSDAGGSGSPEKLDGMLGSEKWHVTGLHKYGIFDRDPRYSDELMLRELRGLDGASRVRYINFGESIQTQRINEIRELSVGPLHYNQAWANHIHGLFDHVLNMKRAFRFVINVFHPDSIFDAVRRALISKENIHLPSYFFFIDFMDKDEVLLFEGRLAWNGAAVDNESIINFLDDDSNSLMNTFIDSVLGHNDDTLIPMLQLFFENIRTHFVGGDLIEQKVIEFDERKIMVRESTGAPMSDYIDQNEVLQEVLQYYYETYCKESP